MGGHRGRPFVFSTQLRPSIAAAQSKNCRCTVRVLSGFLVETRTPYLEQIDLRQKGAGIHNRIAACRSLASPAANPAAAPVRNVAMCLLIRLRLPHRRRPSAANET